MTDDIRKWRSQVDRLLAAPITRSRPIGTIAGKVDDRFDAIFEARGRGMSWLAIAAALDADGKLNSESVESAFRRLCVERGVNSPKAQRVGRGEQGTATPATVSNAGHHRNDKSTVDVRGASARWVDNGDD